MSKNQRILILLALVGIIILTFIFFNLTLEEKTEKKVSSFKKIITKSPLIKRDLKKMNNCSEIKNKKYVYKLADYYISSSFNSALIGNQSRDYLSLQFLEEVILSGARYLEFQINASSPSEFPEPVVGTGNLNNNNWANSLNNLKLDDVLDVIRRFAFTDKMASYPLIIYLDFNSHNKHLIKRVGELINQYLKNSYVSNHKYKKAPFTLEKVCRFNGKIIFLSSLPIEKITNTPFETINMPTLGFVKRIHYDEALQSINVENSLSKKIQSNENKKYNQRFKSVDDILELDNYYDTLLEMKLENPLFYFNKVGMTIIIPHKKEDKFTYNYDPQPFWDMGCQIVAINFQEGLDKGYKMKIKNSKISDDNSVILKYLHKFQKHSLLLKEDDYRFIDEEVKINPALIFNIDEKEKTILTKIDDFYNNNSFSVFSIQSYSHPGYYLDTNYGIIRFVNKQKPSNTNLFMFFPSKDYLLREKGAIVIMPLNKEVSVNYIKNRFLTQNGSHFIYRNVPSIASKLEKQSSFYIVKPSCGEESLTKEIQTVSIRNTEEYDPPFLGFQDKILSTYYESSAMEMKMNSCLNLKKETVNVYFFIKHQGSGLYLKVLKSGKIVFNGVKPDKHHRLQVFAKNNDYINNSFNLKSVYNGNYLSYDIKTNKISSNLNQKRYDNDDMTLATFNLDLQNDGETFQIFNVLKQKFDFYLKENNQFALFVDKKKHKRKNILLDCLVKYELK